MKKTWILILLQAIVLTVYADTSYNELWQKGNHFYTEKKFDSAASYYEKIAGLTPSNAEVYYNLGNSYYRLNNIGLAVLNYERALLYKPNFKKAKDNLELTQNRIANRIQPTQDIFFVKWWHQLTSAHLANTWSVITLVLFLVLLFSIVAPRLGMFSSFFSKRVTFFSALSFVIVAMIAYQSANNIAIRNKAVVMQPDTELHEQKNDTKSIGLLPEGTVVTINDMDSLLVKVALPDGRSGWISKKAILIV